MQKKWAYLLGLFALISGVYLAITIAPPENNINTPEQQTEHLQWYPQPRKLADFTLQTHDNGNFTNQDLEGKWTLVFVGYTYCPDICPATLANIASIYPQLKSAEDDIPLQVWFMSVDPKRDTVERLGEYMGYFHSDFIGTTGPHAELYPLVRSMGMMYSISSSTDEPDYLVDHSASVAVINPQGNIVGRFKPKHEPGELSISDNEQLLADVPVLLNNG